MAEEFFRAVVLLVPDATHMFLEGSPDPNIEALLVDAADDADYAAPVGTIWSWPQKNQRVSVRASSELFVRLSEAASGHAEPEICSHVHFYRGEDAWCSGLTPSQSRFLSRSRSRAIGWSGSRRPLAAPCRTVLPNRPLPTSGRARAS
jgi:hypothetical protein